MLQVWSSAHLAVVCIFMIFIALQNIFLPLHTAYFIETVYIIARWIFLVNLTDIDKLRGFFAGITSFFGCL